MMSSGKIAAEGFDPVYGARPLRRAIQAKIEDQLSEAMLEGSVKAGDVRCELEDDKIVFQSDEQPQTKAE